VPISVANFPHTHTKKILLINKLLVLNIIPVKKIVA